MNILACQISIPDTRNFDDKYKHVKRIVSLIENSVKNNDPPDLIVLPELSVIEYSADAFKHLDVLAEDLRGFSYECFSLLARKLQCSIAYGFPRVENDRYYITHAIVSPEGEFLACFDKIHIAQLGASEEKAFFSPGNKLEIIEIKNFKIAIIICYDFRFPELTSFINRKYQPDLIIHPVSFPRDSTYESWHHFVICRALENQVYFLSLNRCGSHWGTSIFCPPWIDKINKIDEINRPVIFGIEEELKTITLNSELLANIRKKYPFNKDRLKDYSVLQQC